jgi:LysR family transcriptional activator of nhaA
MILDLAAHKLDLIIADRRIDPDSNIKAYNHSLGTSGITFFAQKSKYSRLKKDFPGSLNNAALLLPTLNTALRRSIDQWFEEIGITPFIVGEFDDSALLKVFGQAGMGVFCAPSVIENEILKQYYVKPVGRTTAIQEKYYAITAERRIKHPMVVHLRNMATKLFVKN